MRKLKILVAGHDWGGLNLLAPLLRDWSKRHDLEVEFLSTPVIRRDIEYLVPGIVFAPDAGELTEWLHYRRADLDAYLARVLVRGRYDIVLCSTSAHALLERRLLVAARDVGVASIAFCDMWWAYAERFHDGEVWALPDRLWVIDEPMRDAAKAIEWPARLPIDVIGSPLFGDLAKRRRELGANAGRVLRFISEPVSIKYPEARINEFTVAENVLTAVRDMGLDWPVVIRPHPADSQEAWRRWCYARIMQGVRMDTLPLEEAITDTRCALGISSILLTEMRMCGVPAASIQPVEAEQSYYCIPFEPLGIARLADRDAITGWLLDPRPQEPPASAAVHLAAIQLATQRLIEIARGSNNI